MNGRALFLAIVILAAFGCERTSTKSEKSKAEKSEVAFNPDSVVSKIALDKALSFANKRNGDNDFKYAFSESGGDTTFSVKVELDFANHFSSRQKHLIVKRNSADLVNFDIYAFRNGGFEKVASHEESTMTFENDTIRDINGDGLKDFVVNWYGSNGCCLKAYSDVYILKDDALSFYEPINFVNPTFYPEEKLVRGVCYGQPGMTPVYKQKWVGEKVEDVEYVFFELDKKYEKTGRIVRADNPDVKRATKVEYLKKVPKEYEAIFGFDWFMDDLKE